MEEKKLFQTLIKCESRFGLSDYVCGRISGIHLCMCFNNPLDERNCPVGPYIKFDKGMIIKTICTCERYDAFMNTVESLYPGLCEFNYK